jgi:paraquat-inducible protein A
MVNPDSLLACHVCGQVHELEALPSGYVAECARCGNVLERKTPQSLQITAAFTLSALLLYFPANLFPIMRMTIYGGIQENTIFSGVNRFYRDGDYFVAIVVFLASILIPFLKILGLLFLVIATRFQWEIGKHFRVKLYRVVESLGRWAMVDVFALAILISLVKLQRIASVVPGPGVVPFVLVIVFTIAASASFDPQLIWKKDLNHEHGN